MEEKGSRVNAGKTKIMICGTSLDLLQSFHAPSVALERAATASSARAASTECTRNARRNARSGLKHLTKDPQPDLHGARELHTPWTADHRGKSKSDLTS